MVIAYCSFCNICYGTLTSSDETRGDGIKSTSWKSFSNLRANDFFNGFMWRSFGFFISLFCSRSCSRSTSSCMSCGSWAKTLKSKFSNILFNFLWDKFGFSPRFGDAMPLKLFTFRKRVAGFPLGLTSSAVVWPSSCNAGHAIVLDFSIFSNMFFIAFFLFASLVDMVLSFDIWMPIPRSSCTGTFRMLFMLNTVSVIADKSDVYDASVVDLVTLSQNPCPMNLAVSTGASGARTIYFNVMVLPLADISVKRLCTSAHSWCKKLSNSWSSLNRMP